jgi:hypothetical protein
MVSFKTRHFLPALIAVAATASINASEPSPYFEMKPDERVESRYPGMSIQREMGKPLVVRFADGRELGFFISSKKRVLFQAPFEIAENRCETPHQDARCTIITPFQQVSIEGRWIRHPDASKLNHPVQRHRKGDTFRNLLGNTLYLSPDKKKDHPLFLEKFPPLLLSCENWTWVPASSRTETTIEISSWTVQRSSSNYELQRSENQNMTVARDLTLKALPSFDAFWEDLRPRRDPSKTFSIQAGKEDDDEFANGDLFEFYFSASGGTGCEVIFRPMTLKVQGVAEKYLAEPFTDFAPYNVGQDDLIKDLAEFERTNLLNTSYQQNGPMLYSTTDFE